MRNTGLSACLALMVIALPVLQAQDASLKFEVASIKLNNTPAEGPVYIGGTTGATGRYTMAGSTRLLIQQAYQMPFIR